MEKLGSLIGDGEAAQSLATAEAASTTHEAQGMQGEVVLLEALARRGWTVVIGGDTAAVKHTPTQRGRTRQTLWLLHSFHFQISLQCSSW